MNQALTQVMYRAINKAMNQSQACVTPKAKSFHKSWAFHYRHGIVVGTHNWGFHKYWTQVFDELGITSSQSFQNHQTSVVTTTKDGKNTMVR